MVQAQVKNSSEHGRRRRATTDTAKNTPPDAPVASTGVPPETGVPTDTTVFSTTDPNDTLFTEPAGPASGGPLGGVLGGVFGTNAPRKYPKPVWGVYGGPQFMLTTLSAHSLDQDLNGNMLITGGQAYIILNGWMLGGASLSATLYNMPTRYDEFHFGYGGFLMGYDMMVTKTFSVQFTNIIGGGSIKQIKKRPDLNPNGGNETLERFRQEDYFILNPGVSVGFSPLFFMDLQLGAHFLIPIGGSSIGDLASLSYGLNLMFGFGK